MAEDLERQPDMTSEKKEKKEKSEAAKKNRPPAGSASAGKVDTFRELVESIIIAFALAFVFKAYSAEAFVIPTGSMATTLMGRHKDVECPRCGFQFQVGASSEEDESAQHARQRVLRLQRQLAQLRSGGGPPGRLEQVQSELAAAQRMASSYAVAAGQCPNCRYWVLLDRRAWEALPQSVRKLVPEEPEDVPSHDGDRIIVTKFGRFRRWDVVVFHYPEEAQTNYIKRLVGMPGEVLRIKDGDLYARPLQDEQAPFRILRKPLPKVLAMLRVVYHNDYVPHVGDSAGETIYRRGWPPRWNLAPKDFHRWVYDPVENPQGWLPLDLVRKMHGLLPPEFARQGQELLRRNARLWPEELKVQGGWTPDELFRRFSADGTAREETWLRYRHFVPRAETPLRYAGSNDQWAQLLRNRLREPAEPLLIEAFLAYNMGVTLGGFRRGEFYDRRNTAWASDLALELELEVKKPQGYVVLELVKGGHFFRARVDLASGEATLSIDQGRRLFETAEGSENRHPRGTTPIRAPGTYRLMFINVDHQLRLLVDGREVEFDAPTTYPPLVPTDEQMIETAADYAPAGIGAGPGTQVSVEHLVLYRDVHYLASSNRLGPRLPYRDFPLEEGQYFMLGDNTASSKDAREWVYHYVDEPLLIGRALFIYWPHPVRGPLPWTPNWKRMKFIR